MKNIFIDFKLFTECKNEKPICFLTNFANNAYVFVFVYFLVKKTWLVKNSKETNFVFASHELLK